MHHTRIWITIADYVLRDNELGLREISDDPLLNCSYHSFDFLTVWFLLQDMKFRVSRNQSFQRYPRSRRIAVERRSKAFWTLEISICPWMCKEIDMISDLVFIILMLFNFKIMCQKNFSSMAGAKIKWLMLIKYISMCMNVKIVYQVACREF